MTTPVLPVKDRLNQLRADVRELAAERMLAFYAARDEMDRQLESLRADGFNVNVTWPYGRGPEARAARIRLDVTLD